jgi:DNA repair protein RecN (Recombination protein N)
LRRQLEKYRDAAAKLGKLRRASASRLERAIIGELEEVALERAQFEVRLAPASREGMIERARASGVAVTGLERGSRFGLERAEYHFTANEGEELKPLTGVASGGELSRLMLVLKNITAPTLFPRTLIFDEIDTGIGGRVAEAVGARLKRLAGTNQVLGVTHQAQIARHADAHYRVAKSREGRRTMTRVERLDRRGRIEELARMLAGSEISSLARRHARELLQTGV